MEEFYVLIKHLNFSYNDIYTLPVWKRHWFLNQFLSDLERERNQINRSSAKNIPSQNKSKRIFK